MNSGPSVAARIEQIVANAQAATGLEDFGSDSWREGLEVLVCSAETEGRFKGFGEESFYASLVQPLINRLKIEDWYRRYPEIEDQDVRVELLGVGFPRTGSTARFAPLVRGRGLPQPAHVGRPRSVSAAGAVPGG